MVVVPNEFVVSFANRAGWIGTFPLIVWKVKIEAPVTKSYVFEQGSDADTVEMLFRIQGETSHIEEGWIEIHANDRRVDNPSWLGMLGPMDQKRRANATIEEKRLARS